MVNWVFIQLNIEILSVLEDSVGGDPGHLRKPLWGGARKLYKPLYPAALVSTLLNN